MTPCQVGKMIEARRFFIEQDRAMFENIMDMLRWIGAVIFNKPVSGYKKGSTKMPKQLIKFPWEKTEKETGKFIKGLYGFNSEK